MLIIWFIIILVMCVCVLTLGGYHLVKDLKSNDVGYKIVPLNKLLIFVGIIDICLLVYMSILMKYNI